MSLVAMFLALTLAILVLPLLYMLMARIRFWRKKKFIIRRVRIINAKLARRISLNSAETNLLLRWNGQGYIKVDWMFYLRNGCKRHRFLVDFNATSSILGDMQRFLVAYTHRQEKLARLKPA